LGRQRSRGTTDLADVCGLDVLKCACWACPASCVPFPGAEVQRIAHLTSIHFERVLEAASLASPSVLALRGHEPTTNAAPAVRSVPSDVDCASQSLEREVTPFRIASGCPFVVDESCADCPAASWYQTLNDSCPHIKEHSQSCGSHGHGRFSLHP
jgi:hypothetical protein